MRCEVNKSKSKIEDDDSVNNCRASCIKRCQTQEEKELDNNAQI